MFDVPSVIDWVPTGPLLFELLYQPVWLEAIQLMIVPDQALIVAGPPTFPL